VTLFYFESTILETPSKETRVILPLSSELSTKLGLWATVSKT